MKTDTIKVQFLALWDEMCVRFSKQFCKAFFAEYSTWAATKLVVKNGETDEEIKADIKKSNIMDMPLPPDTN